MFTTVYLLISNQPISEPHKFEGIFDAQNVVLVLVC